ncbi:MAG: hypothetical protein ACYSUT_06100 [Planctomycetota bacterium]
MKDRSPKSVINSLSFPRRRESTEYPLDTRLRGYDIQTRGTSSETQKAGWKLSVYFALAFFLIIPQITQADEFYKEMNLIGGYSNTRDWVGKSPGLKNSVGFEYFKVFSDEYGDTMKLNLQVRFAYDSLESSEDAFGIEIHNAWLDYKLGLGKTIRFGHFDPAFGLEPVLDTHSTLLQTLSFDNIGYKKDWGIGYRTYWGDFDIELAAQLGSGMGIHFEDDNYLLSSRISSTTEAGLEYGLSFLHGQTLQSKESWTIPKPELVSNKSIRRDRVGVDMQTPLGPFRLLGEFAIGEDEDTTVGGGLAQLEYDLPDYENTTVKFQTKAWYDEWNESDQLKLTLAPVLEHRLSSAWTIRAGYFHDLENPVENERVFLMQLYYFGK